MFANHDPTSICVLHCQLHLPYTQPRLPYCLLLSESGTLSQFFSALYLKELRPLCGSKFDDMFEPWRLKEVYPSVTRPTLIMILGEGAVVFSIV